MYKQMTHVKIRVSIFIIATAHLIAIMYNTSCHVQNSTLAGQYIDFI